MQLLGDSTDHQNTCFYNDLCRFAPAGAPSESHMFFAIKHWQPYHSLVCALNADCETSTNLDPIPPLSPAPDNTSPPHIFRHPTKTAQKENHKQPGLNLEYDVKLLLRKPYDIRLLHHVGMGSSIWPYTRHPDTQASTLTTMVFGSFVH